MVTRVSRATLRRMACTVVPVLPVCDVRVGRQQVNVSQDLGEVDIRIVAEALDISNSLAASRILVVLPFPVQCVSCVHVRV